MPEILPPLSALRPCSRRAIRGLYALRVSPQWGEILHSSIAALEPTVAGIDDAGRPAVLIAWIECSSCGRIDKPAHEFNYPEDIAEGMQLFVWIPCENCGRMASCTCGGK